MKIWVLRPLPELDDWEAETPYGNDRLVDGRRNPRDPWYAATHGFVVVAETEQAAREFVTRISLNEVGDPKQRWYDSEGEMTAEGDTWLNPDYTICIELIPGEVEQLVMRDARFA